MAIMHLSPDFRLKCSELVFLKTVYGTRPILLFLLFFTFFLLFVTVLLSHIVSLCSDMIHCTDRAHIYILLRDISQAIIRP